MSIEDGPSGELIAMLDTETLRRIVGADDYQAAVRIFNKIAAADQGDADRLVAWLVREQLRQARRRKAKREQRDAAIVVAMARRKRTGITGE